MKHFILFLIAVYQNFLAYILKSIVGAEHVCRFEPTCAEYARIVVSEKGVLRGTRLSILRLLKCQPLYKGQAV